MSSVRVPKGIVAADLLQVKVRQPKWIVDGLVKPGLILGPVGAGKGGKSLLATELAVAVATGTPALGQLEVDAGSVIYLGLEESRPRLAQRLARLCQGRPEPTNLKFFLEWPRLDARGLTKLDNLVLAQETKVKLVVIDTIALATPVTSPGYLRDYSFMRSLQRWALKRRLACCCISHLTKVGHADFALNVQGSVGSFSSADALLYLSRQRGSSKGELKLVSRETGEKTLTLQLSPEGVWRLALDDHGSCLSPERQMVLAALKDKPPMGPKEVADLTGLSYGSLRIMLRKLAASGFVKRVPGGYVTSDNNANIANTASPSLEATPEGSGTEVQVVSTTGKLIPFCRPNQPEVLH